MIKRIRLFQANEQGQGMTEYIIIVALIALVAIAGVRIFGGKISRLFSDKATQIETETGGSANGNQ